MTAMIGRSVLAMAMGLCLPASVRAEPIQPEPVQAARPCPRHGAGFVRVPGSTACIRIGGRVTTGLDVRSHADGMSADPVAGGRFAIDTRADSDLGPVRAYVRVGSGRR